MKRTVFAAPAVLAALALGACGDNIPSGLVYTDPPGGKALRLVRNSSSSGNHLVLDFIVGDNALTGYSTGFDLPVAERTVVLSSFLPGKALDPGSAPVAARGVLATSGAFANELVVGVSQKAAGAGAVPDDTELAPKAVLFTLELDVAGNARSAIVFDGTAADFQLPSGGLRSKVGLTVVEPADVGIGKLELKIP